MSQTAITKAFEAWLVDRTVNGEPARPDRMIFALIPGQDENAEIDRNEGMPNPGQIRYTAEITQFGALNENAVVYSVVLDTTIGNWSYNWVGLIDSTSNTVLMIVHLAEHQKIKTENGQQGNSLIRNLSMEFDGAATASQITVTPATWMIDFSARLHSMDEYRRLANIDYYGDAAFRYAGFNVTVAGTTATIAPGLGYVAGLRAILNNSQALALAGKKGVWVDITWSGTVTGAWASTFTLRAADTLVDYVDPDGFQHFVTRIATVNGAAVIDERKPFPLDALRSDVESLDVYSKEESDNRFALRSLTVNGQPLSSDVSLTAGDVNAYSKNESDNRFVTQSTTVNGKPLSSNVSINASDVGLGNVGNFMSVQQGGGIGQGVNKVNIGWGSDGKLRLTVDSTDQGIFYTTNNPPPSLITSVNGMTGAVTTATASFGSSGWHRDSATGMIMQWGVITRTGYVTPVYFPTTFPNGCVGVFLTLNTTISNLADSTNNLRAVDTSRTGFTYASAGVAEVSAFWMSIGY